MLRSYSVFTVVGFAFFLQISSAVTSPCVCPGNTVTESEQSTNQVLHNLDEPVTQKHRKRCCPYNFDSKLCRSVGDRYLCGYNINIGNPENGNGIKELSNGCKIRNGRLECGYNQPPFGNFRRPPAADYPVSNDEHLEIEYTTAQTEKKLKLLEDVTETVTVPSMTTRCLEIKQRIVCRRL